MGALCLARRRGKRFDYDWCQCFCVCDFRELLVAHIWSYFFAQMNNVFCPTYINVFRLLASVHFYSPLFSLYVMTIIVLALVPRDVTQGRKQYTEWFSAIVFNLCLPLPRLFHHPSRTLIDVEPTSEILQHIVP